ncbi:Glutamate synthase [NADPH] small chain [hydrothermal vent metagenome]|uniref:Glutamate synthase [NADPH] small chain n=1 Tax=hydrothermal vent metagenome TaxID=652676 RepID=A0A1W1ED15_9ZZZZ
MSMVKFNEIKKERFNKRDADERSLDFDSIYENFIDKDMLKQASRCVKCPVDKFKDFMINPIFCKTGCPLTNRIPEWIEKTYDEDYYAAAKLSHDMSPFPEILGRVCPKVGLCESSCNLEKSEYKAISIGEVEIFLNEKAFEDGFVPDYGKNIIKKGKVAIVGSGPASLSCATFLLRAGVEVELFEKQDRCGGLLTYGIPNFKLPKNIVSRRIEWMKDAGMIIHTNTEVGKDVSIKSLVEGYDALFLGLGAPDGRSARIENEYANGVYHVMHVLKAEQKIIFDKNFNDSMLKDKNVVVIGGGDSAMDAVRTAIRQKAKSSTCIYRRDEESMPGSKSEVKNAKEEGVKFIFNQAPKKVLVDESMNVIGLEMAKTKIELSDDGRNKLIVLDDNKSNIEVDIIILALGFDNKLFDFYKDLNLELGKWNDISINEKQETSHKNVYAGGDVVRGADLAVTAALDGRTAAYSIIEKLKKS